MKLAGKGHVLCNLTDPLFDIVGTETRRKILRLISCEQNYGNQMAEILQISKPTIHRHLKVIQENSSPPLLAEHYSEEPLLGKQKGGKVTYYNINRKVFMFFSIMPKFIHSHIIGAPSTGSMIEEFERKSNVKHLGIVPSMTNENDVRQKYVKNYREVQDLNDEIAEAEKRLLELFERKNKVMENVDQTLQQADDINFQHRLILRSMACLGPGCYTILPEILNEDVIQVDHHITNLEDKGWIEKQMV